MNTISKILAGASLAAASLTALPASAQVTGSIGVVAIHVDESAADTMAGRKYTLIHAGAKKVDGNAHEPLAPEAHADIQADVDALHEAFVALVARNRDLAPEVVRATHAAIYRGQRAVPAGCHLR